MDEGSSPSPPLWHAVFHALPDPVVLLRPVQRADGGLTDLEYVEVNPAGAGPLLAEQLVGRTVTQLWPPELAGQLVAWAADVLSSGDVVRRDDVPVPVGIGSTARAIDVRGVLVDDLVMFTWRDVSDRLSALESAREAEARYRLLAENVADVVVQYDEHRRLTYVSPAVRTLLGFEPEELLGRRPADLIHPDDLPVVEDAVQSRDEKDQATPIRARLRRKDGSYQWVARTGRPLMAADGRLEGGVSTWRDAHHDVAQLEELGHRARTDPLTGLLNRREGWQRLSRDLAERRTSARRVAVLFCGLDGFGAVNENHGHQVGDVVLAAVARRLVSQLRDTDYVIRVGGDETVVVLNGVRDEAAATALAETLRETVALPITVDGTVVSASVSIGVALAAPGERVSQIVDRADRAMYAAKKAGKNQVVAVD